MKKGQIWISAAIYFGLGVVVITIILTAGMPVINKLRDKNTVIQTKDLMFILDNKIREVIRGGAGEQRYVEIEIKRGEFVIDSEKNDINWSMDSKILLSEPGVTIEEGNIFMMTEESNIEKEYKIKLGLDYTYDETDDDTKAASKIKVPTDIEYTNPSQIITGMNRLLIKNMGKDPTDNIKIEISNI